MWLEPCVKILLLVFKQNSKFQNASSKVATNYRSPALRHLLFLILFTEYGVTVWGNTSSSNIKKSNSFKIEWHKESSNVDYNVPGITFVKDLGLQDFLQEKDTLAVF